MSFVYAFNGVIRVSAKNKDEADIVIGDIIDDIQSTYNDSVEIIEESIKFDCCDSNGE